MEFRSDDIQERRSSEGAGCRRDGKPGQKDEAAVMLWNYHDDDLPAAAEISGVAFPAFITLDLVPVLLQNDAYQLAARSNSSLGKELQPYRLCQYSSIIELY